VITRRAAWVVVIGDQKAIVKSGALALCEVEVGEGSAPRALIAVEACHTSLWLKLHKLPTAHCAHAGILKGVHKISEQGGRLDHALITHPQRQHIISESAEL
jgi:hypothetical protein